MNKYIIEDVLDPDSGKTRKEGVGSTLIGNEVHLVEDEIRVGWRTFIKPFNRGMIQTSTVLGVVNVGKVMLIETRNSVYMLREVE